MDKFRYVKTPQELDEMCLELSKEKIIGVDLECENGLHHYGTFLALIQVSTRYKNWIIDPILLKNIDCFLKILTDERIEKVFHDVSFDFRILNSLYGTIPKPVFDTQIAAHFLNKPLGLKELLKEYFEVEKEEKFQKADWTRRPINKEMLSYAVKDSSYLIALKEKLQEELRDKFLWVLQECRNLEQQEWNLEQQEYTGLKGFTKLTPVQRAIVKALFLYREKIAKEVDRPVYFVISNKRLVEIAKKPLSLKQWKTIQQVHPIVKRKAEDFYAKQEEGKNHKIIIKKKKPLRMKPSDKKLQEQILNNRDLASKEFNLSAHLIASKDQMKEYALTKDKEVFRPWQRKLLKII